MKKKQDAMGGNDVNVILNGNIINVYIFCMADYSVDDIKQDRRMRPNWI